MIVIRKEQSRGYVELVVGEADACRIGARNVGALGLFTRGANLSPPDVNRR